MEGVGTSGGGGGGIGAALAMGQPPMGMPPHQGGMIPQYHQGGMMPMPGYQMGTSPHQYQQTGGGMMPMPGYQMGTSPRQYHHTGGGMLPPPGYQMGSTGPSGYGESKGRNPPTLSPNPLTHLARSPPTRFRNEHQSAPISWPVLAPATSAAFPGERGRGERRWRWRWRGRARGRWWCTVMPQVAQPRSCYVHETQSANERRG